MNQSEQLTEFYNSYKIWLEEGAPDMEPFSRNEGLCFSVQYFSLYCGYAQLDLLGEMNKQFKQAGLFISYPFNGSGSYFSKEKMERTMHLNPARIKWVMDHADP